MEDFWYPKISPKQNARYEWKWTFLVNQIVLKVVQALIKIHIYIGIRKQMTHQNAESRIVYEFSLKNHSI